jgi:hypothetical protein
MVWRRSVVVSSLRLEIGAQRRLYNLRENATPGPFAQASPASPATLTPLTSHPASAKIERIPGPVQTVKTTE